MSQTPLFLEDLFIGTRFSTGTHAMDEEQIKAFAKQFDPQPFHLDVEAAKKSFFGELVASGWHTASITMKLLVTAGAPIANGLIGMEGQIAWPKAVHPGDVLHVEVEIVEITPSHSRPDRGIVTIRAETFNQNNEAVQIMTSKLLVFRQKPA